jgi:hypothetical protein
MVMTLEEFRSLVAQLKVQRPVWFKLESDRPATEAQIKQAEWQLMSVLPEHYHFFVKEFGGGTFALGNVLSVQPGSDWNIVDFNRRQKLIGSGFLAVSDGSSGDLYGFKCEGKACRPEVWEYDHDAREWRRTSFNDLLEFVHRRALTH